MKKIVILSVFLIISSCASNMVKPSNIKKPARQKKYQLLLVHGLANPYKWSDEFLDEVAGCFGSGNVFIIALNKSTAVKTKTVNGKLIYICGDDRVFHAGKDSIETQAGFMKEKTDILSNYGLSKNFNIIAHSMGGLISRRYTYLQPGRVVSLVTLGTPHHGSELASDLALIAKIAGSGKAAHELLPDAMKSFNSKYPVSTSPLADEGAIYTIDARCDGKNFGTFGEIYPGYMILSLKYGMQSDGLVPEGSAKIDGATHIASFDGLNHLDLILRREVAEKAVEYLK